MGESFEDVFLPSLKERIEAGLSYDVEQTVKIPGTWGARIDGEVSRERASKFEPKWGTITSMPVPRRTPCS